MRVLVLTNDVPATPSVPGSPRVALVLRGLQARGHALGLACGVSHAARWREFLDADGGAQWLEAAYPHFGAARPSFGGRVRNLLAPSPAFDTRLRAPAYHAAMTAHLERALADFQGDVLHVDQLEMAQYVPETYRGVLVIDPHDAFSLTSTRKLEVGAPHRPRILRRRLARYQIEKIRRHERAVAARADAYVVNAEPDRAYLEPLIPRRKLHTIPNAVDTDHYHPAPGVRPDRRLVFVGNYASEFNVDAMLEFHRTSLPRVREAFPDIRLSIVGPEPPRPLRRLATADPLTSVTGYVVDARPYVWESAVSISPLRGGTGMKNKVLNAMALGRPVVATPISVDGIAARDGEHVLLAPGGAAFADRIVRLLEDAELARRLSTAGRALVEERYGPGALAAEFERLYRDLLDARRAGARRPPAGG